MNVVMPATVSRARVVPFSENRNRRPRAERSSVAAKSLMRMLLSAGEGLCRTRL
jgi:hypothetical protein